ncbi:MAG: ribonuclease P protein component [Geodermatophilaceae bacterium]|nr:ribonuclease P protein component [Geodermatophilaceae bacterium]MDQ3455798.1 ribonuclease P protein component [Actinomycetota bacterium]
MLPPAARLRHRDDFVAVLRHGRRAARGALVVHLLIDAAGCDASGSGPRVGLVVGQGVGGAVRRNEVSRRLRHLMRPRLHRLPDQTRLVVRALPAAAGRSSVALGQDLDATLDRLLPARVGTS